MKHKSLRLMIALAGTLAISGTSLTAGELVEADQTAYRAAFRDAAGGNWVSAFLHAGNAREKLPAKALTWPTGRACSVTPAGLSNCTAVGATAGHELGLAGLLVQVRVVQVKPVAVSRTTAPVTGPGPLLVTTMR